MHAAPDAGELPFMTGGLDAGPPAAPDAPSVSYPGPIGFADVLFAQAENSDQQPPVKLRMEKKFDILAPKKPASTPALPSAARVPAKPKDAHPVFITADQIEGRSEEVNEAEGNVELRKYGNLLLADKLTYWPLEDEVDAVGHVVLRQNADEMSGPHLRMRLSEQIGFFEQADYKFSKEVVNRFYRPVDVTTTGVSTGATTGTPLMMSVPTSYGLPTTTTARRPSDSYGHAERIDFKGENQISLTDSTYSTCKPSEQDWYLKADKIDLDYDRGEATADNATLVFKDTPIFYLPTGSFSLNRQRKSGFLPATLSPSTKNGLDLTIPYYWNLAPNYDATFYPREMAKRGFQLGAEIQYVDYNYRGLTRLEYMPRDTIEERSRYAYNIMHTQNLGQGFSTYVNWNGVSDDLYWQDLSTRLLQTTQTQLPRQLLLTYAPGAWWTVNMQTLRYQTLSPDPANPVARPYFIEPQINFSGRLNNLHKTDLSIMGQYTKFSHPTQVEGGRVVFYPQWSLPYVTPGLMATPKIGLHATQYALNQRTDGGPTSISRVLPTFSFDTTVFFERDINWVGSDYVQTLEPRLYYVYIPYKDQSKIPVFDTALSDFNFAQIFYENRYTGFDRINDANQLTAGVTTRFLDAKTGAERFKAMIGQRYYFKQQRVSIPGETSRPDDFSNFLAAFNGAVLPKTYVDAALEYDYHQSQTGRFSVGMRYQPELAKVLSASYRFVRDPTTGLGQVEQFDIAGQWPLDRRWYAVGRYNYSLRDKQALEVIGGLEYNAGCWAARAVVQHLTALVGSPNTTFFFQLELNDFASVGSANPVQLLRRSIPGYGKVNELPTTGSLLTTQ